MKITTTIALHALTALCLLAGPACDSSKKDAKADAGKAAAKKAETKDEAKAAADVEAGGEAEAKADDGKAAAEAKADGADAAAEPPGKIGVAECDEYISKMSKCFADGKVPAENRDAQRMGFDASVKSWTDSAKAHPESMTNLVPGCKAAIDAAKKLYPACFPT